MIEPTITDVLSVALTGAVVAAVGFLCFVPTYMTYDLWTRVEWAETATWREKISVTAKYIVFKTDWRAATIGLWWLAVGGFVAFLVTTILLVGLLEVLCNGL